LIDQTQRIREIFTEELEKHKITDTIGAGVTGPTLVPNDQGDPVIGWIVMVTLKHNILLGQPDIGAAVPIAGVLPPDDVFRHVARRLLEETRRLRHEASTMSPEELAARQQGGPNVNTAAPPGLLGKNAASVMNAARKG
jgi:hypothetical protein